MSSAETRGQFAIEPTIGVLFFDDSGLDILGIDLEVDPAPMYGVRAVIPLGGSWRVEGAYGFSSLTVTSDAPRLIGPPNIVGPEVEPDFNAHFAYASAAYAFGTQTRAFLSGGVGAFFVSDGLGDGATDPLVSVGAGVIHPLSERVDLRGEVRQHATFCSADLESQSACVTDETLTHFELSGGIEIWL